MGYLWKFNTESDDLNPLNKPTFLDLEPSSVFKHLTVASSGITKDSLILDEKQIKDIKLFLMVELQLNSNHSLDSCFDFLLNSKPIPALSLK